MSPGSGDWLKPGVLPLAGLSNHSSELAVLWKHHDVEVMNSDLQELGPRQKDTGGLNPSRLKPDPLLHGPRVGSSPRCDSQGTCPLAWPAATKKPGTRNYSSYDGSSGPGLQKHTSFKCSAPPVSLNREGERGRYPLWAIRDASAPTIRSS